VAPPVVADQAPADAGFDAPWLDSGGSGSSTHKATPIGRRAPKKNDTLPYIIGGVVLAVVLVLGAIGLALNGGGSHGNRDGGGVSGGGGTRSLFGSGGAGSMTKMQFRQKVNSFKTYVRVNNDDLKDLKFPTITVRNDKYGLATDFKKYWSPESQNTLGSDWVKAFGEPTKTQTVADSNFLYWQCSDGLIQVHTSVDPSVPLADEIIPKMYYVGRSFTVSWPHLSRPQITNS
jgi:hypothetical protein